MLAITIIKKNKKMKNIIITVLALLIAMSGYSQSLKNKKNYDFTVKDINGGDVSLKQYEGKVLLLVSKDGKTILRFEPMVTPEMLEKSIQEMLK